MSHTVIAEFHCNEGKGAGFLEHMRIHLGDTRAFKGCQSIEVYTNAEHPDHVLLFEKWATPEDHGAYMKWRGANGMAEMLEPFMSGMPKITHLDPQKA